MTSLLLFRYSGHSIPPYFETKNSFYLELATNYQDMYEMNGTDPHGHVDFTYDPEEDTDETNSKQNRTKKMNTNYYGVSINYTSMPFHFFLNLSF